MKRFLFVIAVAGLPLLGCAKSVERAQHDVQTTRQHAADKVRQEQRELQDTRQDAAERIARQERRVEDAAREGNKEITKEQRDLEEARRAEVRRDANDLTPPINDRTAIRPDSPARVDVNIQPGPGVKVDVNRNP
jgi:cell division protein FtsL